jgi:hypothetical protein
MLNGPILSLITRNGAGNKLWIDTPFTVSTLENIGVPEPALRETRAPFQHGTTYKGMSFNARDFTLGVWVRGNSHPGLWQYRRRIISFLNPLLGPLRMQITFPPPSPTTFYLQDVFYQSGMSQGIDANASATKQLFNLSMRALDPIWYEATEIADFSENPREELVFPVEFPIWFDEEGIIFYTRDLLIGGDFYTWPKIVFTGPLTNPQIANTTTGAILYFPDFTIPDGVVITVITTPGHRQVFDNMGNNYLNNYLSFDSQLLNFNLVPAVFMNGLPNSVFVFASGANAHSSIIIYYNERYVGL